MSRYSTRSRTSGTSAYPSCRPAAATGASWKQSAGKTKSPAYAEIKPLIERKPELLYIGPSYLEIELTGRCDLDCLFCYRKTLGAVHGDMDPALAKALLEQMKRFDLPYTVCFGGSGEPLMHPNFYEIAFHGSGRAAGGIRDRRNQRPVR